MNLRELLKDYKIEIPILQRDFAQGRKSQEGVAKAFLDSIFEVLEGEKDYLHLDFIFGYKENDKFILIDGQQRITTLWLLHFYLHKKANRLEEIKELLSKFSYNTRKSSKNFCKNLLNKDFDISQKPSKAIRNKGGEFEKENNLINDPTIKAMLHMLDLIFEKIKDGTENLVDNLDKLTFNLFDMKEYSLGEELYIKMNARGKQLSKYENLKSFIEKDLEISQDMELLKNIDTCWSDYFFDYCKPKEFDIRGKNFLHYATLFFGLENDEIKSKDIKEIIESTNGPVNDFYKPLQEIENIKVLDRVVKLHSREFIISETLKLKSSTFFGSKDESLKFLDICYFFSILSFCKRKERIENIDENAFNDYLRVCRHFIENHRLDKPEEQIHSFFNLFEYLAQGHNDIYSFLIKNPTHNFHSNIYSLEVRKAKLILASRQGGSDWETILNRTSEHNILKGWVDFLLDFSDEEFVYEEYNESKKEFEKPNLEKFKKYANLTMQILNKESFLDEYLTLFQRALLCMGDYGFYSTNYFYGNSPRDLFRDREALNWILRGNKNRSRLPYFKKFLDQLLDSGGKDLIEKMEEIIDKTNLSQKRWWEQLLIGQEGLFDFLNKEKKPFQEYRRIRFFNKNSYIYKIELLPGIRKTIGVVDLLDYGFYCFCKQKRMGPTKYDASKEQYEYKYKLLPRFSLNDQKILCKSDSDPKSDSMKPIITIDNKDYQISLKEGINVFVEFDRVLKEANLYSYKLPRERQLF